MRFASLPFPVTDRAAAVQAKDRCPGRGNGPGAPTSMTKEQIVDAVLPTTRPPLGPQMRAATQDRQGPPMGRIAATILPRLALLKGGSGFSYLMARTYLLLGVRPCLRMAQLVPGLPKAARDLRSAAALLLVATARLPQGPRTA